MKRFELNLWIVFLSIAIFSFTFQGCKNEAVCPECGEANCIYQQIDKTYDEGTDTSILNAIYKVCNERKITDPEMIDLIKANYNL